MGRQFVFYSALCVVKPSDVENYWCRADMSNSNCCASRTISLNVEKIVSGPQIKKYLMFFFVLKLCFSYNSVSIEGFEYFDHLKPKNCIFGVILVIFCVIWSISKLEKITAGRKRQAMGPPVWHAWFRAYSIEFGHYFLSCG